MDLPVLVTISTLLLFFIEPCRFAFYRDWITVKAP